MSRRTAIAEAKRIYKLYKLVAPISPTAVARVLGLRVFYLPDSALTAVLLPLQRAIIIGTYQSPERRAFCIAHEIGHWVLENNSQPLYANNGAVDHQEIAANAFAAELLMPADLVKVAAQHMEFTTLAAHFGVSLDAMHIRVLELGIQ